MPSMPSPTRSTVRRNRNRPLRRGLHVEALERREVLAGNVTAQLVGSTLLLTGDALGNELVVASVTGGRVAVIGNDTTVNGSTGSFVTARPVVSIIANLGGGNDGIGFGNDAQGFADQFAELGITPPPAPVITALQTAIDDVANGATTFSLPGSLAITMDGGSDVVSLIGNVGGSLTANLGSAPTGEMSGNALMIGGFHAGQASRVGGAVSIVGGAQRDAVELVGTTVGGGLVVGLGNGANSLNVYESSVASLAYTGGGADDDVDVADLGVRYGVSIVTGAGQDEVYVHEHGGPQTVVGAGMVINTGSGDDYVEISSAVRGGLSLVTGAGADEVQIYETSVGLNAVINTDGGDDRVSIDLTQVRFNLFVSLGAGNDDLELTAIAAFAAFLDGGPGGNTLAIDDASRNAIRRLFVTRFQAVT